MVQGLYEEEAGGGVEQRRRLVRVHRNEGGDDRIQTRFAYYVEHRAFECRVALAYNNRIH